MNFEMSGEAVAIADAARGVLRDRATLRAARQVASGGGGFDRALWDEIARLGWLGVNLPEAHGGTAAGSEALCLLAFELGGALAPVPFASTVYFAADAIANWGSPAQCKEWLPQIAAGHVIATAAVSEGLGDARVRKPDCRVRDGRITGSKWPVADGSVAQLAVVFARDEDSIGYRDDNPDDHIAAFLVGLDGPGVTRRTLASIDPSRDLAALDLKGAPADRLGTSPHGRAALDALIARAAVPLAFEQIGGAQACLDMAVGYARTRYAFGQPIGAFQAIKHKLADVYIALELARSNCYFAAWAHASGAPELPVAAAAAWIGATDAHYQAARENMQTHGGLGMTAEADCHLYLRRSRYLSALLGSSVEWKSRLIAGLAAHPEFLKD